jgi:Fe-S cluster biogenesis protein NfuA/NifU-like protein involved in Fe-S cluster formation
VLARLATLRFQGELAGTDATASQATLIATAHGAESAPEHISLWLLVDTAGVVRDVRYRTAASGEMLAAYDVMAELCVGRTLTESASGITPRAVDTQLRLADPSGGGLTLGSDADTPFYVLTKAAERLTKATVPAPATSDGAQVLPWNDVGLFEKVRRIESVLDQHVRAALASDGGGLDLVDLKENDLFVQYQGACGSCSSSIGGTLQFIQDSLNNHLGTTLQVKVSGTETSDILNL